MAANASRTALLLKIIVCTQVEDFSTNARQARADVDINSPVRPRFNFPWDNEISPLTLPGMGMNEHSRIYVAGHRGLVGSAIWRELQRQGFKNLIGRTRQEVDLLDAAAVTKFYAAARPEFVFVAAAKVGGILANDQEPAAFLFENLQLQNHLLHGAYQAGVKKLLFLGSSCIYPKLAPQPLKEEYLLSGPLEPTNQWYA